MNTMFSVTSIYEYHVIGFGCICFVYHYTWLVVWIAWCHITELVYEAYLYFSNYAGFVNRLRALRLYT